MAGIQITFLDLPDIVKRSNAYLGWLERTVEKSIGEYIVPVMEEEESRKNDVRGLELISQQAALMQPA